MRKISLIVLLVFTTIIIFSCNPYGKKVKINEHFDVYVKKDATVEEAKKLGQFLASFDSTNTEKKSVQLTKENDVYTVRLVIDNENLNNPALDESFEAIQYLIKANIFPGKQVKLVLADTEFKDKKAVKELQLDEEAENISTTDSSSQ